VVDLCAPTPLLWADEPLDPEPTEMADDGERTKITTDDTVSEALPHRSPAIHTPTDSTAHPNLPESRHEN